MIDSRYVKVSEPVVMTKKERISVGTGTRIDSFAKLEGGLGLTIGERVHIASFVHLNIGGGALTIGDGANFSSGAKVITGRPTGESFSVVVEPDAVERSRVTIGKNASLMTNAVLIGASMGEGAVLAAGAVATRDIPAFEVWAGVPAILLKRRDGAA